MKKASLLHKILSASLAITIVGGVFAATPIGTMLGTDITVSAASSSPVVTAGNFQYVLYSDGTANVVGYTGVKDQPTTSLGMPSVVYASEVSTTWSYLQYNSSYKVTQMQAGIFSGYRFNTISLPRYLQSISGGLTGAEGGESPYVYGVYYKKASAEKWSTAQSYKDNTSVTFKPGVAVTYDVCVKVKDSTGKIEKKYFVLTVTK